MPSKNIRKRPKAGGRTTEDAAESLRSAKAAEKRRTNRTKAAREIESSFSKLNAAQLEQLGLDAFYARLPRPVPASNAIFDPTHRFGAEWDHYERAQEARKAIRSAKSSSASDATDQNKAPSPSSSNKAVLKPLLSLPKRPRWNRDMTKKSLEANEAEVFRTWLRQTDEIVSNHAKDLFPPSEVSEAIRDELDPTLSKIPSQFERNLSVFAQLWRVSERSDLLCVLLDTRCPMLHLPPSLIDFLRAKAGRRTLLVLTKADLVPRPIAEAWRAWLLHRFGEWTDVVITESYKELGTREGQGSRQMRASFMGNDSRTALINSLKKIHAQLTQPPTRNRSGAEVQDSKWEPPCVQDVDWEVFDRLDKYTGKSQPQDPDIRDEQHTESSQDFLTIGLIGQPNVGKSSMLNALLGSKLVRASKTPGKTKAFQTHFVGQAQGLARPPGAGGSNKARIRLCDSPGLVFPSLVGMEMQVLGAILPISQIQAISSCVRFAAAHMPLEEALRLPLDAPPPDPGAGGASKVASTGLSSSSIIQDESASWTAVKILEHVAARYNFRTAKANRWDTNRAGNLVMRALAEGRIAWAFRPPLIEAKSDIVVMSSQPVKEERAASHGEELVQLLKRGKGIWLGGSHEEEDEDDEDHEGESDDDEEDSGDGGSELTASQTTTNEGMSGSMASLSLKSSDTYDNTDRLKQEPIRINFRRPKADARSATDSQEEIKQAGKPRSHGKEKKKSSAGPVLSKRARLREEGLALLAAKAEDVERRADDDHVGEDGEEGEAKPEFKGTGPSLGGSIFLNASSLEAEVDDDDESDETDTQ
ncbi:hypothetical protein OC845_000627 [Tilletia horrida]|nr:hypothetical protein OC845_000627 [Tilletia horrida]